MALAFKALLFSLLFLLSSTAYSSTSVKLQQIGTEDGLNQSDITGIMQDKDGFLWFSSNQGINRYDGYRVTQVESPDNILLNNFVEQPFEDSTGKIWIGASPHHTFILDKAANSLKKIKLPQPKDRKLEFPVFNIAIEDKGQNLWISTYTDLFFYDRARNQFDYFLSLSDFFKDEKKEHIVRAIQLVDNYLFVGTTNGLYAAGITNKKIYKINYTGLPEVNRDQLNVKFLSLNRNGELLVGTVEGLFKIARKNLTEENYQSNLKGEVLIESLNIWKAIEKDNFYWLATDKGLYKYHKTEELEFIFRFSDTPYDTSDDDIVKMIEDREGNLWMGTRFDGIFKWRPNPAIKAHYWHKSQQQKKLSQDTVFAVHQTRDQRIWIGTQNGLNILDPKSQTISHEMINPDEKAVYSESTIYQIVGDSDEIWMNTQTGLQVIDANTLKPSNRIFPKTEGDIFKKYITSIHFLDRETLAIVNEDGMYHYNVKKNQISFVESTQTNKEVAPRLGAIFDTATGDRNTYFISGVDRLVKYSRSKGSIEDFHKLPPSDNYRTSPADVYRDGDKLWVTYSGYGVYVLDANSGKEIKFISEEEIGSNTIMDIFDDEYGNLWFTSNEGLIRINKVNYNTRIYDKKDGFATSEFNGGTKLEMPNGEVYIGSVKGLFRFSPSEIVNRNSRRITNHITGMKLLSADTPRRYSSFNDYKLELEYDDFGLAIDFSALLFDKPKQVKFKYWFEGDTKVSPTVISDSELFLPTIEQGQTTLFISAIDYETGLESEPAKLFITSHPAPWFSPLAYVSYVIIILSILSINYYRYSQRMLARKIAHDKLYQSEERLNLALKGGNSGLWDWHAKDNLIYEPRLYNTDSGEDDRVSFNDRIAAIHPDDRDKFLATWSQFILQDNKVFDVVYRMKNNHDNWAWYRDMATVSDVDENNKPIRVTGTFTNITDRKEARDKMRLLSTAFENTRDIVFVLDNEKKLIAANQSFYKQTEFDIDSIIGAPMNFLTDQQGNRKIVAEIFKNIHLHSHWTGEGLLNRKFKKTMPVLVNATSFISSEESQQFVFALTDISEQKAAENELRKLANYDILTGLPNRALLMDRVTHAIDHCRRRKQKLSVFFIDLDRFKQINDTLGHDIGDLLLINVAQIIQKAIRIDDTVARLGGDEFVVLLEDIEHVDAINRIARNIIEKMQETMLLKEHQVSVSPSIGIANYPNDGEDADTLLKHADIAMYHAKNAGRNNFQYFENSMNHKAKERLEIENQIRSGVSNDEFFLVYQPQYSLNTGEICGVEALARWKNKEGELISPGNFIPIAEDIGLIIPITERLLDVALEQLSQWHKNNYEISLAFNLSARHLHHYDFNSFVEDMLNKHQIKSHLLEFELTESILMKDMEIANRIFGKLSEHGIELALDDFGTGYSSLKYLNQLPINKLKIDRSFVSKIGISRENDAIIQTIISLGKSLELKTVAEGIETEAQLQFMQDNQVDQAQGFYFSKPISATEITDLLNRK